MSKEMQKALEADGEKLRQLTGEDHGPWWLEDVDETCPTCGTLVNTLDDTVLCDNPECIIRLWANR